MRISQKVKVLGNTVNVPIPKAVVELKNIERGDIVEFEIIEVFKAKKKVD